MSKFIQKGTYASFVTVLVLVLATGVFAQARVKEEEAAAVEAAVAVVDHRLESASIVDSATRRIVPKDVRMMV